MSDHDDGPRKSKEVVPSRYYHVGYGKPPVHSRFAKGKSGNPKGRPKGSGSLASRLQKMLGEEIAVQQAGNSRRMKKGDAVLAALIARAARGDTAAARLILNTSRDYEETMLPSRPTGQLEPIDVYQLSDEELIRHMQKLNREIAKVDPELAARLREEADDD